MNAWKIEGLEVKIHSLYQMKRTREYPFTRCSCYTCRVKVRNAACRVTWRVTKNLFRRMSLHEVAVGITFLTLARSV